MKHKINASQTRKAELNIHSPGLISKYLCKHFLIYNANRLIPQTVSFAVADAKQSTSSETTVQIENKA